MAMDGASALAVVLIRRLLPETLTDAAGDDQMSPRCACLPPPSSHSVRILIGIGAGSVGKTWIYCPRVKSERPRHIETPGIPDMVGAEDS